MIGVVAYGGKAKDIRYLRYLRYMVEIGSLGEKGIALELLENAQSGE